MAINVARIHDAPQAKDGAEPVSGGKIRTPRGPLLGFRLPFSSKKVTLDDLAFFTRQLALLLRSGNGLVPSIDALARQASRDTVDKQERIPVRQLLHDRAHVHRQRFSHPRLPCG